MLLRTCFTLRTSFDSSTIKSATDAKFEHEKCGKFKPKTIFILFVSAFTSRPDRQDVLTGGICLIQSQCTCDMHKHPFISHPTKHARTYTMNLHHCHTDHTALQCSHQGNTRGACINGQRAGLSLEVCILGFGDESWCHP